MEEEITNKPTKGTWDRLGTDDGRPKISFEVNIPQTVTFTTDNPEELDGVDGGVYYKFIVMQDNVEKYFTSSAWTLLGALKELVPLKDKKVVITKKLIKGKQTFEVK
jgi:hypothetical protein